MYFSELISSFCVLAMAVALVPQWLYVNLALYFTMQNCYQDNVFTKIYTSRSLPVIWL